MAKYRYININDDGIIIGESYINDDGIIIGESYINDKLDKPNLILVNDKFDIHNKKYDFESKSFIYYNEDNTLTSGIVENKETQLDRIENKLDIQLNELKNNIIDEFILNILKNTHNDIDCVKIESIKRLYNNNKITLDDILLLKEKTIITEEEYNNIIS